MSSRTLKQAGSWMALVAVGVLAAALTVRADEEFFPRLNVGSDVYSNVTVTTVTATDVYFTHAHGLGNAKLKTLDPALQKHFQFEPAKARDVEKNRVQANAQFREQLSKQKPPPPRKQVGEIDEAASTSDDGDIIVPKLYARSFRGQRPPQIIVEEWVSSSPDPEGKFVLVEFWATWCGPCRKSIPHLNDLAARFRERLVVIGLSDESLDTLQRMTSPPINYFVGTDTQARTLRAVGVEGIPHSMLIDPRGIVRFEGLPVFLTDEVLARLISKYGG